VIIIAVPTSSSSSTPSSSATIVVILMAKMPATTIHVEEPKATQEVFCCLLKNVAEPSSAVAGSINDMKIGIFISRNT
jgi:hypothetical protein